MQIVETVSCRPDEFLAFVMDIERYAEVDTKISPILWRHRDGDLVEFACRPKLAGLRQPKVVQLMRLTPGRCVDISLAPLPRNRLAHAMAAFDARFDCVEADGATQVTRTLEFRFAPAVRWLFEPLFRRRLPGEVERELRLAEAHFAPNPHRTAT